MQNLSVDCVIVTFNKREMLEKSIKAIDDQTYKVGNIFVVNNNSTDNTKDYLDKQQLKDERIVPFNLNKNLGGAGGFNYGIRKCMEISKSDYIWIIDDDAIADRNALLNMIKVADKYSKNNIGFLASNVRWKDGKPAYMNIPSTADDWSLYANENLVKIKSSSFVSMLVAREAIKEVGLPISEFFIWGDDVEFSYRITSSGYLGLFVNNSEVIHFMNDNVGIDIMQEHEPNRIKRYFYEYRNSIYNTRIKRGNLGVTKEILKRFFLVFKILTSKNKSRFIKIKAIILGTLSGIVFKPHVEKV